MTSTERHSLPPTTDTHPTSRPDVPAAAARLRELAAVCEAGGGDGWLETPWPRAREIADDLRVVLAAVGQEVVTGAQAAELPDNTLLVPCTSDGKPALGHHVRIVQDGVVKMPIPVGHEWLRFLVHRPAPASAPLTIGDVVEDAADLDRRATVGTIVEDAHKNVGRRTEASDGEALGWGIAGLEGMYQADELACPVTVVRVGTGDAS